MSNTPTRVIKFRAWDKRGIKMLPVVSIEQKTIGVYESGEYPHIIYDEIILMQFTGLFDKNKTPIYEGDIVKFHDDWGHYYYVDNFTHDDEAIPIGEVKITTYKGVVCKFKSGRFTQFWEDNMTSGERPLKGMWSISSSTNRWEVIGNIYENKELLS